MTNYEVSEGTRWLLLIHQLPAKPAYARVKVWRRLQALGAVTVKGAVYTLPANAETQEDFAWLAKELDAVVAIDFFGANGRLAAQGLVEGLEAALQKEDAVTAAEPQPAPGPLG